MHAYRIGNLSLIALCFASAVEAESTSLAPKGVNVKTTPEVRMVYLIPSDRVYRAAYEIATGEAIEQLRAWYQDQSGTGKTFVLHKPVVEVVQTLHPASWYATNPVLGVDQSLWFWMNATSEGFALTAGSFYDPNNIWVFYLDADPSCGQAVGAAGGVALLPANDLRGLTGEVIQPLCDEAPRPAGVCRWVGGLGHELGHTFGLPHPQLCTEGGPFDRSLMCLGYLTYPGTVFSPDDKSLLDVSPFLVPTKQKKYESRNFACSLSLPKVGSGK
jgi:hypothetical protein